MIFLNPIAWLGLAAVVVPLAVHLLARRPARHERFPTVRFLPAAALRPVRRGRPSDWMLLVVRMGIVAAAVAALTQPLWLSSSRQQAHGRQIARAVVIDTSRSMARRTSAGESGIDAARREARRIATDSTQARIAETTSPAALIDGSVNWLATQPMRRELVIVSDFQTSAISAADLERVPNDIGRKLIPVSLTGEVTSDTAADRGASTVRLLASGAEQPDAEAARAAALTTGAPSTGRRDWPVAVMFPSFADREAWLKTANPVSQSWMFDVATEVAADPLVIAALDRAALRSSEALQFFSGPIAGADSLVVVMNQGPHTLLAAATIRAVLRAAADAPAVAELDPAVRSASDLRALEREPATAVNGRPAVADQSDGRWLWAAALLLIGIEGVLRRSRRQSAPEEVSHARVA